jgi:malonate-semialdehyde dehydrogenase (acetylating)/methylmalonate-semialdehyde dehydrogenase
VPVPERARLMMRYQALLKEHHDELGEILAQDTGKTFEDAKGDVWRGIEVVEQAANIPSLLMGETVENVARRIDTYSFTPAPGRLRGHHAIQLPGHDSPVDVPLAIACRQHLRPQALGAGSADAGTAAGAVRGGRRARRAW